MLIICPECELQVSDKALSCPHCGYPMKSFSKKSTRGKSKKRRRLPNGFGQISEIKGRNLRKPFRAMVTVGKSQTGRPICKPLKPDSYFETYNDAYAALVEYNKNPYDLDVDVTVFELYEQWFEEYKKTIEESSTRTITSAWAYCSELYKMRAKDVRGYHIKACMENGIAVIKGKEKTPSASTKQRIKSLFNLMLDYAVEHEIVDRNYARTFNISDDIIQESEDSKRTHIPYSFAELNLLWENVNKIPYVDVLLLQCYSGWRPQEIGLIEVENVDLEKWLFNGGMKTPSGKNRVVPIHPKIRDIVTNKYKEAKELNSKYLINCTDAKKNSGLKMTYDKYRTRVEAIRDQLKLSPEHRAHDGRNTFVTMAKKYNVDEYAIKYIVGHSIKDVTEKVYTKREIDWLVSEMNKIP